VRTLCERYGSRLRIVHVVRRLGLGYLPATRPYEEGVIAKLKSQTLALRRHGINASLHVIRDAPGSPARHIADTAHMVDADLLIIAGRGRGPLYGCGVTADDAVIAA
jgi:nucleotide-binding universal stress UspA family protein